MCSFIQEAITNASEQCVDCCVRYNDGEKVLLLTESPSSKQCKTEGKRLPNKPVYYHTVQGIKRIQRQMKQTFMKQNAQ